MLGKGLISREEFCLKYRKANALKRFLLSIEDDLYDCDEDAWQDIYDELITSNRTSGVVTSFAEGNALACREYRQRKRLEEYMSDIHINKDTDSNGAGYVRSIFDADADIDNLFLNKVYSKFLKYLKLERRGSRSILYQRNMPAEKVIAAYKTHKTTRKTAQVLEMSHPTVSKILKEFNVEVKPPGGNGKKYAAITEYMKQHPEEQLPRNVKEISDITGSTESAVYQYLYRRKIKYIKDIVDLIPDLREMHLGFKKVRDSEDKEVVIPSSDFEEYKFKVDKFDLSLTIDVHTIHGEHFVFKHINAEDILAKV